MITLVIKPNVMEKYFNHESKIDGQHGSFLSDVHFQKNNKLQPAVLFVHGFKNFKDWGTFNLMAKEFVKNGFIFYKFNKSHNGTTIHNKNEINNLDAFSQNNISKEMDDLDVMINHVIGSDRVDQSNIFLIGHSFGGAVSIIKASEDERIKGLICWGTPSDFELGFDKKTINNWKKINFIM